jgi:hypothetical protein
VRPLAVLTNIPKAPETNALYRVCKERGLPLVTFQHGLSREISATHEQFQVIYENNSADLFFTFNRRSTEISNATPFARGRALTVGLPGTYAKGGGRRRRNPDVPAVFYVSTLLYTGNIQNIRGDASDQRMASFEIDLIDEVLARLPHRVFYKPYPASRYLDPDPVLERARSAANVTLYEGRMDLRYLLPDARVLITSRATTTVIMCVQSRKPVVFIDIPDQLPLRADARPAFAEGLFYFDGGSPDLHRDLRAFLAQPLADIERQWADRAAARARLVDEYFGSGGPGAGERAARHLLGYLDRR